MDCGCDWAAVVTGLLSSARVLVVAGKGGVGKSTVTAVLARAAARDGRRVLAVGLDGKGQLGALLGDVPLLELTAADALQDYLDDHGFGRIARRLNRSGVIDVVSTAAPGIDDIVVLGRIKQLEQSGEWDLIVVDGPAAGHAVTMLTSPAGLQAAVRGGPVRTQAEAVVELLGDPQRSAVVLVTLAETTPVSETIETAALLSERVGVALAGVVVNAVDDPDAAPLTPVAADAGDPALLAAARFRDERRAVQRQAIAALRAALPLEQLHLPVGVSPLVTPGSRVSRDQGASDGRTLDIETLVDVVLAAEGTGV